MLSILSLAFIAGAHVGPLFHFSDVLPPLLWVICACFVLVFWSFGWLGPLWGLGALVWLALWVVLSGLAVRQAPLAWMSLEMAGFGWVAWRGFQRWEGILREASVHEDHLREELNTLQEEIKRLDSAEAATRERFKRYQKLRRLANALQLALSEEDLVECIVHGTAGLVDSIDHVLLYLVNPDSLELELRKVWRRQEGVPVKAKQGDAFDQWVMRKGQPLLVEDVARDFRFEQVKGKLDRTVSALLAVPLISKDRSLGVLRLESSTVRGLGADDLRLVRLAGDLISLGIENGLLYGRMAKLAMTDDLTGLRVKEHFLKELEAFLKSGPSATAGCVLLIDIDHFKEYNDQFGHSAGDKLLQEIGKALLAFRRPGDAVARFGGEEFVCLLRGLDRAEGRRRAEEIRVRVEASPVKLRREMTPVTVSVGLAACPEDGFSGEDLLRVADSRLYLAKRQGRNQVCSEG